MIERIPDTHLGNKLEREGKTIRVVLNLQDEEKAKIVFEKFLRDARVLGVVCLPFAVESDE